MTDIKEKIAQLRDERNQVMSNAQYALGVLDGKIQALEDMLQDAEHPHVHDNGQAEPEAVEVAS